MNQALEFFKSHPEYIVVALLILVIIIVVATKENFDGYSPVLEKLASYPSAFLQQVVALPNKAYDTAKDFLPAIASAMPMSPPIKNLEVESQIATIPVAIGNGMSVQAEISVPAQTVDVPAQVPMSLPTPEKTSLEVPAQVTEIKAQTGLIPTVVDGKTIQVPVSIPTQMIDIKEQNATKSIIESFTL